ncbi:MAG TPA: prepilin-type N-terminal cleavage/methylation domain-containing protein [Kofleriaceae bacterium]|nr:prepilin-type N-terminal cleavage/methylation domain-containing protein [Kofleriaceae bacterium]
MKRRLDRRQRQQGGFTVVEVLIALLVLLIGMAGMLSLQLTAMKATGFSRHATEATVLTEDRLESLRTAPVASLTDGSDQVDAAGNADATGLFTRTWTITPGTETTTVTVSVAWQELGADDFTITMSTLRTTE